MHMYLYIRTHTHNRAIDQLIQSVKKEGLTTLVTQKVVEQIKTTLSENSKSPLGAKIGALMIVTSMYEQLGEGAGKEMHV